MEQKKGIAMIIIAALMFGSYGIWSRLMGDSFGTFFQGWTRAFIISIILLPILLWNKQIVPIARKDWGWMAVFLIFTSCTQAPLYYSFNHMDVGSATLLFFVSMLLTMYLFGIFFLGEKITLIKAISFVLAGIGMSIVFSFSLIVFTVLAVGAALLNGIASGGEIASSKKLTGDYSPLYVAWLSWVIIFITNTPISLLLGEVQHVPTLNAAWLYQMGFVIVSIFGFWLMIKGVQYTEASIGGLIGLLEIVFSIALGVIIFNEQLTFQVVLGATFIILAAALPHMYGLIKKSTL
jgi:drug/metabolite transporter (DMT)-like permease